MNTCIIFGAAAFTALAEPIHETDLVIAADGGLVHTQALGITPNIILGDFDSLGYVPEGAQVHPVEKDDTDTMLAVRKGLAAGFTRFVFYGALDGPRLDHTVANLQTLLFLADHGAGGWIHGSNSTVTVLKNETVTLAARKEGLLSLFCFGADAHGVSVRGAQYELEDGVLRSSFPLGVSNHFVGKPVTVTVREGSLIAIYDREEPVC